MPWLPYAFVGGGVLLLGVILTFVIAIIKVDRRLAEHVRDILQRGADPQQAVNQLAAEGVDPMKAVSVVKRLLRLMQKEAWINQTLDMLHAGTPEEQIRDSLMTKGLKAETAACLVQELAHPPWIQRHPIVTASIGVPIMIVGCGVMVASLIVRDGNLTGKWLPFRKPGFLTLDDGE
jgi:hypothetical protein